MSQLSFNYGRVSFSHETFEMTPTLPDVVEMRVQVFYLAPFGLMKSAFVDFEGLSKIFEDEAFVWLHLSGSLSTDFWKELKAFGDLSDEQVKFLKNPHNRTFIDEHAKGIFWTVMRPFVTESVDALEVVNFCMKERLLITRQFSHDDAFTMVIHRLMALGDELSNFSVDRLAADLMEDVVRSYFDVLNLGGNKLEILQNRIIRHPGKEELNLINRAQQVIWIFLKTVWPLEGVTEVLARSRSPLITAEGRLDLAHCQTEAASALKLFETYRSMSYDIMDVYVSGLSLRTNETTKVLTVIATLFLPPTLIAGIYGMNFQIPEISITWGYYICLSAMAGVSGGLLWWLTAKGYIDLDFRS